MLCFGKLRLTLNPYIQRRLLSTSVAVHNFIKSKITKMPPRNFDVNNPVIELNETEAKISVLLNDYVNLVNSRAASAATPGITGTVPEQQLQEPLELRITGGWVRDKLLGNESNDIDIAINSQSGEAFAEGLRTFIAENSAKYQINPSGIHKIEKNPEKSKHLETATTKLYGLDVDFVNLRSEEYTEDSRIPVIQFGTPEEDALRRDATLNALFYNLSKNKVEDLTKTGLQDLKDGILKTPLPPLKTFLDDPLRVLRLIRFAARFNFVVEEETLKAMSDARIKEALSHKISRERVGVELEKTLTSANPVYGLELIDKIGFFSSIFNFGAVEEDIYKFNSADEINEYFKILDFQFAKHLPLLQAIDLSQTSLSKHQEHIQSDKFQKKLFWLTFVLEAFGSQRFIFNKAKKEAFAIDLIIREGVKYSKLDTDSVVKIITTKTQYQEIVEKVAGNNALRSEVGLLLRNFDEHTFAAAMIFNLINEHLQGKQDPGAIISKYETFNQYIIDQNLTNVNQLKHLANGKVISKKFNKKPGPWMAKLLEKVLVWQLDNPELGEEECFQYIETIIAEFL
ncbi:hypothetical protein WICPIJ_005098 [Wickerhamomyces pijperi]|uniref:CCA tRNA nucleotidyltransferase, mitochondrial n=1 Tax=Wickerhamomyces pijperi TaxID=599730 RepID=A0A9P8TLE6_WICPI|nr:hypothetical protein WICPIJ_005098 [Wickerhamomyces pijperi]